MHNTDGHDSLVLYGQKFASRFLLGTARYESPQLLMGAIESANPALLTVSLRRQLAGTTTSDQPFRELLQKIDRPILPNTAGCYSVREAVNTACMARELFETNFLQLEVIGDEANLQPDPFGLVEAAAQLVKLGFNVLPYCTEDWVICRRLIDVGCQVLMPWAAPIGTGQGPRNPAALQELRARASHIPLIVDAGIGLPSHACQVMEWGFDGVLINTAVARAVNPVLIAAAFSAAIAAGRDAWLAEPMPVQKITVSSTPEIDSLPRSGRNEGPATLVSEVENARQLDCPRRVQVEKSVPKFLERLGRCRRRSTQSSRPKG